MTQIFLSFCILFCSFLGRTQYSIDPTFHGNGSNEYLGAPGNVVNGQQIAYDAANSVYVAGRWNDQLCVWKYLQSGELDPSFGINGMASIPMPSGVWTLVKDLEVMPDGRIVVLADALLFYSPNIDYSQCSITVARFLPDGNPDSSFNGVGILLTNPQNGYEYMSRCLTLSPTDGSIYVGGYAAAYGHYGCASAQTDIYGWFALKLLQNGTYDLSFANTGYLQRSSAEIAQTSFVPNTYNSSILDIKVLPDEKILMAGAFNHQDYGYFSLRVLANGSYDNSYANNGRSAIHDPSIYFTTNESSSALIFSDEQIVYVAQYTIFGLNGIPDTTHAYIYKLDAAGQPASNFGNNGQLLLTEYTGQFAYIEDAHQRLIFNWYGRLTPTTQEVGFRRLLSNGQADLNFGTAGRFTDQPIANDVFLNSGTLNDLAFNADQTDLSNVSLRSASYVPTTFRVLNYHVDTSLQDAGVAYDQQQNKARIFPNPANERLQVVAEAGTQVCIRTALGEVCWSGTMQTQHEEFSFPTELPAGIYWLDLRYENGGHELHKLILNSCLY
ncbi:MAG: hypothetical protein RLZZ301_725 [Bacteroidota bacterium]|jgi:uncharacterized delta-60 repeat protein